MRIKELRESKRIQQKDLAIQLNIPPNTLSQYENEKREPNLEVLQMIAEIFNVTTDYLIGKDNFTICSKCHNTYDPLNKYDSEEHDIFHKRFTSAENKFGEILLYGEASKKREDCIFKYRNPLLSLEEKVTAFGNYLKYDFMVSLWNNNFDLNHDDFETYCQKEIGLISTKEALDEIDKKIYPIIVEKYGILEDAQYHKVTQFSEKDNRDIKKDLDNIMDKLQSKEYGPAAYNGEDLSPESAELFRDELEIALKRLKLINKEKYNPNKNKE